MEITPIRRSLFEVPIWEVDLSEAISPIKHDLARIARDSLNLHPAADRPFRQSTADLAQRYEVYRDLAGLFVEVAEAIVQVAMQPVVGAEAPRIRSIDCWALEVTGTEAWDEVACDLGVFHTHPGAFFSSVLHLEGEEGSPGSGGTLFRSPVASAADPRLVPPMVLIPWRSCQLLLFPAWLEHGPARPASTARERLTIATDFLT